MPCIDCVFVRRQAVYLSELKSEKLTCSSCATKVDKPNEVLEFKRKLSNPGANADYDALSDRAKAVLLDHFKGLDLGGI